MATTYPNYLPNEMLSEISLGGFVPKPITCYYFENTHPKSLLRCTLKKQA